MKPSCAKLSSRFISSISIFALNAFTLLQKIFDQLLNSIKKKLSDLRQKFNKKLLPERKKLTEKNSKKESSKKAI